MKEENSPPEDFAKLFELVHEYRESLDFYQKLVDLDSSDINAIRKVVESYLNLNEIDNAIGTLLLLQCTDQTNTIEREFYFKVYLEGAKHSLRRNDHEEATMRFWQAYHAVCRQNECECEFDCVCCDIFVLCLKHATDTEVCKLSEDLSNKLASCLEAKVLVNDKDCIPGHRIPDYLNAVMEKAKYIIPILTDSNSSETSEFDKYLMDIISGQHYKKSLAVSVGNVNCNFEHEINVPGESCNDFSFPEAGQLVSEIITKISDL
jgi:hypothetical protein